MSEVSDMWRDLKKSRQLNRAKNRDQSAAILRAAGIDFYTHNDGAHLIVQAKTVIDFWPGTGRWKDRADGHTAFGVKSLIKYISG